MKVISYIRQNDSNIISQELFPIEQKDRVIGKFRIEYDNECDLKNPKTNHFSAGFSDEERGKFTELLESGFNDTFRTLYPEKIQYSWWSYMYHAREKNVGWRIDYFVVSERLMPKVKDSFILTEIMGSDHCPVGIELEL